MKQPAGLISVLLDENATISERDDAAMDLSSYDEPEAEAALISVATDPDVDEIVAWSVGESLAEIWCRKGRMDRTAISRFSGPALSELKGFIKNNKPAWLAVLEEEEKKGF